MENPCQNKKIICRLCWIKCDNFGFIEGSTKDVMDMLLLKINLVKTESPVICANCAEKVKNCFTFKSSCLNMHNYITPFVNDISDTKLDLKDIYLIKKKNTCIPEDHDICGFCMELVESYSDLSLDKGDKVLKMMLEKCLPELDLTIIENPKMCAHCHESLEDYFRFLTSCLISEEKVSKCENDNKNLIDMTKVPLFMLGNVLTSKDDTLNMIKEEECLMDEESAVDLVEDKNANLIEVKDEKLDNGLFVSKLLPNCKEEDDTIKTEAEYWEQVNQFVQRNENFVEMVDQNYLHNEDIEIKMSEQDLNRFEDGVMEPCNNTSMDNKISNVPEHENLEKQNLIQKDDSVYQCEFCSFQTKYKGSLKRHSLQHKEASEITMYRCEVCFFLTKHKSYLNIHRLIHKQPSEMKMYRCEPCEFQTKREVYLKKHMLVHKLPSETAMYQCEFCSFKTKYRKSVSKHIQFTHKYRSEMMLYQCKICPFETKYRESLRRHSLVHKDLSELTTYQCASCSYQTKYKNALEVHTLIHRDPSEVTIFQCDSCSYQTKRKDHLKLHSKVHKDSLGIVMYNCDSCPFQTKRKQYLSRHMFTHKDFVQVTDSSQTHQCKSCSFTTTCEMYLQKHTLTHKQLSEVTVYQCDVCSFQSKYKHNLKKHVLMHKDPSELTMHQCDSCSFQTKYKNSFDIHMLTHKDSSQTSVYQCEFCPFQTKCKAYLTKHLLIHKSCLDVKMHQCDSCPFQTRYRASLRAHLLTHKSTSEITMHRCESCSFETKYKHHLQRHVMLKHRKLKSNKLSKSMRA